MEVVLMQSLNSNRLPSKAATGSTSLQASENSTAFLPDPDASHHHSSSKAFEGPKSSSGNWVASVFVSLLAALLLCGCGGYSGKMDGVHYALRGGRPDLALEKMNNVMGVESFQEVPEQQKGELPLYFLERGMLLHAIGQYELSSRDLQVADANIEVLDLTKDTAGSIAKYLYSEDKKVYKAAPHEKVLINTVNMLNYLSMGNLSGARVEARRLTVIEQYLADLEGGRGLASFGAFLAGYIHERSGQYRQAMRYYGQAYERGGVPGLERVVRELHRRTGATDVSLKEVLQGVEVSPTPVELPTQVLIVVHTGVAPRKKPVRHPIATAMVEISASSHRSSMSDAEWRQAQMLAASGSLKWLSYPTMYRVPSIYGRSIGVSINGRPASCKMGLSVEEMVIAAFDEQRGALMIASLTRMVSRAVAGAVVGAVGEGLSDNSGLGFLLQLGAEGALMAADTPDTRSWSTLPANIHFALVDVSPGEQEVDIEVRGSGGVFKRSFSVDLPPSGFRVVSLATLR